MKNYTLLLILIIAMIIASGCTDLGKNKDSSLGSSNPSDHVSATSTAEVKVNIQPSGTNSESAIASAGISPDLVGTPQEAIDPGDASQLSNEAGPDMP